MISLKKIGKLCNISESTVSKALKNDPKIKLAMREKVFAVAKEYGYQPNAMIEYIQTHKSKLIGIAINHYNDAFAGMVMEGVHQYLAENDYDSCVMAWDTLSTCGVDIIARFGYRRVDGLLLFPSALPFSDLQIARMENFYAPIVLIDQRIPGHNFNYVGSDNRNGIAEALESLRNEGCECIGMIAHSKVSSGMERLRSFLEFGGERELVLELEDYLDYSEVREFLKSKKLDAVLCFNDIVSANVRGIAMELNLKIPEDIKIVGYGDLPFRKLLYPAPATIDQQSCEIGRQAAQLLLSLISDNSTATTQEIFLPSHYVK